MRDDQFASHVITFPAKEWGNRSVDDVLDAERVRDPDTGEIEDTPSSDKWHCAEAFDRDLKNVGTVALRQLADPMMLRIIRDGASRSGPARACRL